MFLRLSQACPEPNASESGRHNHIRETLSRGSRRKRGRRKRPTPMFLTICATNHVGAECPNRKDRVSPTAAAVRATTRASFTGHSGAGGHRLELRRACGPSGRSPPPHPRCQSPPTLKRAEAAVSEATPASGSDHSNIRPRLRMRQEGVKKCAKRNTTVRCESAPRSEMASPPAPRSDLRSAPRRPCIPTSRYPLSSGAQVRSSTCSRTERRLPNKK